MHILERQIIGAIILVLLLNVAYVTKGWFAHSQQTPRPILSEQSKGYKTIELKGSADVRGIYFVSANTTLSDFLNMIGINGRDIFSASELERKLDSGDVISVMQSEEKQAAFEKDAMKNSDRHVLDMPINLNTASSADLMLVPGIGEKTANSILEVRKDLGGFSEIEDLLQVHGIGSKKLEAFRKYLYVNKTRLVEGS